MRIHITHSANSENFFVIESFRKDGKSTSRVAEKLGNLEQVKLRANGQDPYEWANEYAARLTEEENNKTRTVMVPFDQSRLIPLNEQQKYNIGYLFLQKIYYQLGLRDICKAIDRRYDYDYDLNSVLSRIVYGRILSPASKLGTYEFSKKLLEGPEFSLQHVYRSLDVLSSEQDYILSKLYEYSGKVVERDTSVIYYDCTNYFFELEHERGQCKYGPCKENRPLPIVQMGLLIDGNGIPLSFCINDGNRNEQKTLKPLEEKILEDFGLSDFIICTDSGLSSADNKFYNSRKKRNFITATSISGMEQKRRDKIITDDGWKLVGDTHPDKTYNIAEIEQSEEEYKKYYDRTFYKEEWYIDKINYLDEDVGKKVPRDLAQRLIVTFSFKYKAYLTEVRNNQIARAIKMIDSGKGTVRKKRQNDPANFIMAVHSTDEGEVAETTTYALDREAIEASSKYDGFYAVYTSLSGEKYPVSKINRISHNRWEIEECFRILKTDFEARPVYLRKDNRINAHFLTCFIALLILRVLEYKLDHKFTYPQILSTLEDMDICKISDEEYVPAYMRTELTDCLHEKYGFRTDNVILPKSTMKKICTETKRGIYYHNPEQEKKPKTR